MSISEFHRDAISRDVVDAYVASGMDWSVFCEQYELIELQLGNFIVRKKLPPKPEVGEK